MALYLVTGAAGFIGSKVTEFLLKDGHQVVGIDNLNSYYDVNLKKNRLVSLLKNSNFIFHKIDIENAREVEKLFSENHLFEAVLNIAAMAGVRYSIQAPMRYINTNVGGTLNLLECCKKYQINKFVLSSTSSLYAGQSLPFQEDLPVNTPISPYAASKKAAEVLTYPYHDLFGPDVTILRYFTVYGPAGRPDMSIFRFIKWIDEGRPLLLFGDGTQSRDFTFID
ncbi:MAG: NAD-dependent epimerase/dehydratase family protein, partial [Atribacterota bacterium]